MPDATEILPLSSCEDVARFAVEDAELEEVTCEEIRKAKPRLLDESVFDALATREF